MSISNSKTQLPGARLLVGAFLLVYIFSSFITNSVKAFQYPNDPGLAYTGSDLERQWYLPKARFLEAWNRTTGSAEVTVAILDTGIDSIHQDLGGPQILKGYDFVNDREIKEREDSDDNGHGTMVTGVLGARVNNGLGISGAVWNVKIIPVKVLNSSGEGTSEDVAKGIRYATDNGANIINMSFGGAGFAKDTSLSESITYAFKRNVVIVAAAGNDLSVNGNNLDENPVFPICDDNGQNMIIGVTALDYQDKKPSFANYGKNCVDVSAPGKRILSTIGRDPLTKAPLQDRYAFGSGTSLASPLVSAQAVLLKTLYPLSTNRQIRDRIISTAVSVDKLNEKECSGPCAGLIGAGRIDVYASLASPIVVEKYLEGDLIEVIDTGKLYEISGGKRLEVIPFVKEQKFKDRFAIPVKEAQVNYLPLGTLAAPLDGSLVKSYSNPTVYFMMSGSRMPISYQVFLQRGLNFSDVKVLYETELNAWLPGKQLSPPDGSLVKSANNPTVYWAVGNTLHPISQDFYRRRGLDIFKITVFSDSDVRAFPKGESYF